MSIYSGCFITNIIRDTRWRWMKGARKLFWAGEALVLY